MGSASQVDEVVLHRDIDGAPSAIVIVRFCVPNLLGCNTCRFKSAILAVCRAHSRHGVHGVELFRKAGNFVSSDSVIQSIFLRCCRTSLCGQPRPRWGETTHWGSRELKTVYGCLWHLWIQMWNDVKPGTRMLWHALTCFDRGRVAGEGSFQHLGDVGKRKKMKENVGFNMCRRNMCVASMCVEHGFGWFRGPTAEHQAFGGFGLAFLYLAFRLSRPGTTSRSTAHSSGFLRAGFLPSDFPP